MLACLAVTLGLLSEKTNAHRSNVTSVAFSPDGTKIVSGSYDKTIKVWDSGAPRAQNCPSSAKTNACCGVCLAGKLEMLREKTNAHSHYVMSVAFSPDGTKIVSGSDDKTIKVWDVDSFNLLDPRPGEAIAFSKEAEGRVVRDGSTIRMKDGGGTFYAPSPISCVAVSWPRIAAGAQSGELYHLEVM